MNTQWWRMRATVSAVVTLAVLTMALLIGLRGDSQGGTDPPDTTIPSSNADLINLLTVNTTTINCAELVGSSATMKLEDGRTVLKLEVGALMLVGEGGRRWSDALSTPVYQQKPSDALKEIQTAICQDPLFGATVAHLFAHMEVEGTKIVDLNDWLKPFAVETGQINDLAAGFIPLLDGDSPTNEQLAAAISQNLVYQALAEKLSTLLNRFSIVGIQTEQSTLNYHLDAGGLVVGKLPEVAINAKQENLPALVLEANVKPGNCLVSIGFNIGVKRPEVFGCPPVNPPGTGGSTVPEKGKDATKRPPQDPVISCPTGQFADRVTGKCTSYSSTTTTVYDNSGGNSGPGAPGPGVSTPTTDPAPDPTVPTNTGPGDGSIPDPGV